MQYSGKFNMKGLLTFPFTFGISLSLSLSLSLKRFKFELSCLSVTSIKMFKAQKMGSSNNENNNFLFS